MNLGSFVRECEGRTGFNDSTFQERWRRYINAAIRDFARKYPWPGLERELTTTLRTGNRYLVFPHHVDHITDILNVTDRLPIMPRGNWGKQAPNVYANLTQGRPLEYRKAGHVAAAEDPSGFIWLKSSHASDVNPVYVTGYVAASGSSNPAFDSIEQTVLINAAGVSPVTLSTQFSGILSIAKATSTNGDFFFFDAGNSNNYISFIPAAQQGAAFRRLEFMFIPSADKSLRVKYIPKLPFLTDDTQTPHPTVKPDYIIEKAIAIFQRYQGQYQKGQYHDAAGAEILGSEANKEENFTEPFSQIQPEIPGAWDVDSDYFRGGY
jgi:hypothetical protein